MAHPDSGEAPTRSMRRRFRLPGRSRSGGPGGQNPDEQLFAAIGRIAVHWSSVEITSGFVLMELVGRHDDALAQAVVAGQRVENVWDTIEALLSAYHDDARQLLETFMQWRQHANLLRRRRNEVIHSAWSASESTDRMAATDVMSRRAKRGARADLFPEGVAQLEQLAQDIAALEDRLDALQQGINEMIRRRDGGGGDGSGDTDDGTGDGERP
jgi:hypothetical protein